MSNNYKFFSSFIIGICAIAPAISGSVIATFLGIYDYVLFILNSSYSIYIKIKKLFVIFLGFILGVLIFGKVMYLLYYKYEILIRYFFIGLIFGSIRPFISRLKGKINIFYFLLSLIISLSFFYINNNFITTLKISYLTIFLGGFLYILGKILPGISSSSFLLILGIYKYYLLFFNNPFVFVIKYYKFIFIFLLGALLSFIIFIKFINYLLNKNYNKTYSFILGLIVSSIIYIYPGFIFNKIYIISILIMILSFTSTSLIKLG